MPLSAVAILLTLVSPYLGLAVHVIVAVLWFVPDRRVERQLEMQHPSPLPEELER